MSFTALWQALREQCERIDPESVLVTPSTNHAFTVETFEADRIVLAVAETGDERSLWRPQFEVLYDRLVDEGRISLADLPVGVEPYVAVLSLAPQVRVHDASDTLQLTDAGESATAESTASQPASPFLQPDWAVRTPPERVHDDALLLADLIDRFDVETLGSIPVDDLVDLYVLLSDVQHESDRLRRTVGDTVLEYIGPDDRLHGRFGTVRRTRRKRRRLKDEETILSVLDDAAVPREWVLGVDREKLDVVLAATDLDERAVYDVDEQVYVQKTAVEEEAKQPRLQGLKDRLADLDSAEAEELREDIEAFEDRLDTMLATG